jgi:hypothetical protein
VPEDLKELKVNLQECIKVWLALRHKLLTLSHYVGSNGASHRKPYIRYRIPAEIQEVWQDIARKQFLRQDTLRNKMGAKQRESLTLVPALAMSKPFCNVPQ